jgi:site-specific DNA-methyltransferase (adenine-specific)
MDMEINTIYNENCLDTMARMPDEFIDLTVTSPPYDNIRDYKGYSFDFEPIAQELFRVTKKGGVVVWVVNDATVKGSETGTSFRQALYFKEIGFNLHDTMIWDKGGFTAVGSLRTRYGHVFDYMFILSKGSLKSFNPIKDRKIKKFGEKVTGTIRQKDGSLKKKRGNRIITNEYGQRFNIWRISPQSKNIGHPAVFPEIIANDHIISWSNENDLIYDPFMGSGTTAKMAVLNYRNYIGSEISAEYCEIIKDRIEIANEEVKQIGLL